MPAGSQSNATSSSSQSNDPKKLGFLEKMEIILGDASLAPVISWSKDGQSFFIHDVDKFSDVLPRFFRSGNVASFVRQLNFYGFRKKQSSDRTTWEFYHDKFKRDRPELRSHIKRRTAPDFHAQNEQEMKELKKENKSLKSEVSKLKSRIEELERQLKAKAATPAVQGPAAAPTPALDTGTSERIEATRKLPPVKRQKIAPPVTPPPRAAEVSDSDLELDALASSFWRWPLPGGAATGASTPSTTAAAAPSAPLFIRAPSFGDSDMASDNGMDGVDRLASPPALAAQRSDASMDAYLHPPTPNYFQGSMFQDIVDADGSIKEQEPYPSLSPPTDEDEDASELSIDPPSEFLGTPLRQASVPEEAKREAVGEHMFMDASTLPSSLSMMDPRKDVTTMSERLASMTEQEKQALVVKLLALLLPLHLSRNAQVQGHGAMEHQPLALTRYGSQDQVWAPLASGASLSADHAELVKPLFVLSLLLQQMTVHQVQAAFRTLDARPQYNEDTFEAPFRPGLLQ